MISRHRRIILVAALALLVAAAYVVYAVTRPHPSGAQVSSLLARLPENGLVSRIACKGSGATWTCRTFGPGPSGARYVVHVRRDGTVTVPPGDGQGERRVCCVP
jgi:hypothetical protein